MWKKKHNKKKRKTNSRSKSVQVMNRKEAHEKWVHQYKYNCDKMEEYVGIKSQGRLDCTGCVIVKARGKMVEKWEREGKIKQ